MPSFRNPKQQAVYAVQQKLQCKQARHTHRSDGKIHSLGTARNYTEALTRFARWLAQEKLGNLQESTETLAQTFLEIRSQQVGQKMLDQERQAIQTHLDKKLPRIRSEWAQVLSSRAYRLEQVQAIVQAQTEKYQLATRIACAAGLRAHELLTLQPQSERMPSQHRDWSPQCFRGRSGERYTVVGKGGLIRAVLIPRELAAQLEARRLNLPVHIQDRQIFYSQWYDIGGGKGWSNSFSAASKRLFGWSHGAHGLRHHYAQQRMAELQQAGLTYHDALGVVSQELGHFRPDITEVYLR